QPPRTSPPCGCAASPDAAIRRRANSAARCAESLPWGSVSEAGCGPGSRCLRAYTERRMEGAYELFQRGTALLAQGDFHAAVVPLSRARDLEPEKDSIREALGRALFHTQRYEAAREEFEAVVEHAPTNDYALFCLGRSLQ